MKAATWAVDYTKMPDGAEVQHTWGKPAPFIKGGMLQLQMNPAVTANTVGATMPHPFTYGRVEVTMRADNAHFKTCPLLWPLEPKPGWVAEYDFAEGADRLHPTQTLHYLDGKTHLPKQHPMIHRSLSMLAPGLSVWTTLCVAWSRGHIETWVKGLRHLHQSVIDHPMVPDFPMQVHLQIGKPGEAVAGGLMQVRSVQIWDE